MKLVEMAPISTNLSVSPDGRSFAYFKYDIDGASSVLKAVVADIKTGETRTEYLVQRAQQLKWTPDGKALTYVATKGQSQSLMRQPLSGKPATTVLRLESEPMLVMAYDWSPDGKKLAVTRAPYHDTDIVMFSIPPK